MSPMSATDVADRVEISDLIARYAAIIDARSFDDLDALFTADATVDYSAFGGPAGDLAEIKTFLGNSLPFFARSQHMMGLPLIDLDGDSAHARTSCNNPMISTKRDGSTEVWLIGLWYDDDLVRTAQGWRFTLRSQTRCYTLTGLTDHPMGA